jgi:hypothetical protein
MYVRFPVARRRRARSADDTGVVAAITECARVEAAAAARRLAAIAELVGRRADGPT